MKSGFWEEKYKGILGFLEGNVAENKEIAGSGRKNGRKFCDYWKEILWKIRIFQAIEKEIFFWRVDKTIHGSRMSYRNTTDTSLTIHR